MLWSRSGTSICLLCEYSLDEGGQGLETKLNLLQFKNTYIQQKPSRTGIIAAGKSAAHKHTYLFKLIHKRHFKAPKKRSKSLPKAAPDTTWNQKISQTLPRSEQKPLLGGRGHHRARQMNPKGSLQTGPRATKSRIYVLCQKNLICGISLEATETLLGG